MKDRHVESAIDSFESEAGVGLPEFLKDPIRAARRRLWWMLLTLLIGLTGTVLFCLSLKPRYLSSAVLLVSSQQIPEDFVRPIVRDDSLERINAMVGSVLATNKLSRLIEKYDLYALQREHLSMSDVVAIMRKNVDIKMLPDVSSSYQSEAASRYEVSFVDDDPVVSAQVANELASLFTESSIETRRQQARLTTDFLRKQLEEAERDLREHEQKIREFKEKYQGELPDELDANLHKLEQLQLQRQSLAKQVADGETRLAMLLSSPDANSPEARLAAAKSKLAQELSIHTEEHPNVTSLRRQIAALEEQIKNPHGDASDPYVARSALVTAERHALDELRKEQQATEAQLREIDARVANTPKRQEAIGALEEKASVLRDNYRNFLRKVQDAELAQNLESAQQGERVVVLDRAEPPSKPMRNRRNFMVAGFVVSFGLSLLVGVLLEVADPVVVSSEHVEATFALPVLGSVNRIS